MSAASVGAAPAPPTLAASYDVAIVGGGIQGCAVAQAAAAAGFSTLLMEQGQWAEATSSRSSKLIHGGLRYLQSGQWHLVRECLHERDWMLQHCPELVQANWFYLPIYAHSHYNQLMVWLGLSAYRWLNRGSEYSHFKRLPKQQWPELAGLKQAGLKAVFAYQDAQTDDRRLTQAVQQSAQRLGATCLTDTQLLSGEKQTQGYRLQVQCQGAEAQTLDCRFLVNASGPWVNQTLANIHPPLAPVAVDLVQGTHLIIDQCISEQGFYVEAPADQRAVFILPWQGKTLIGTTETLYQGDVAKPQPLAEEISYLCQTLEHYFPDLAYSVVDSFSGLRVLPRAGKRAFLRSREVMLDAHPQLLSLYGGKLTAWRQTAEAVMVEIEQQLGPGQAYDSHNLKLH